jgi:hypothetical protein
MAENNTPKQKTLADIMREANDPSSDEKIRQQQLDKIRASRGEAPVSKNDSPVSKSKGTAGTSNTPTVSTGNTPKRKTPGDPSREASHAYDEKIRQQQLDKIRASQAKLPVNKPGSTGLNHSDNGKSQEARQHNVKPSGTNRQGSPTLSASPDNKNSNSTTQPTNRPAALSSGGAPSTRALSGGESGDNEGTPTLGPNGGRGPSPRGIRGLANKAAVGLTNAARNGAYNIADHVLNGATRLAAKTIDAAKTLALKTKQLIGHTIRFIKLVFFPPGLWVNLVVLGVIMSMLIIFTSIQTFGPSDLDCSHIDQQSKDIANDGGASSSGSSESWMKPGSTNYNNAKNVWDYWVAKGFSGAAVAGIMGNVHAESGFNPTIIQGGGNSNDPSAAGSGGYGLYQFTPGSKYKNWAGYKSPSVTNESDAVWDMEVKSWSADSFAKLDDVAAAAKYWMRTYERPADQSDSAAQPRVDAAQKAYDLFGGSNVQFDSSKFGGPGSSGSSSDSTDAQVNTTKCDKESNGNDSRNGSVNGALACDKGGCDFDWMCSAIKVCKSGDAGTGIYPHLEYGYQCVWYAWNRLGMIHGTSGWTTVLGNGGDIWANLSGNPNWEVDRTPHPGDGISGTDRPFAWTTHVAVVEKVASDPSGWKIYISEGNDNGRADFHSYGTRWLTKTQVLDGSNNHFFRNKNWK